MALWSEIDRPSHLESGPVSTLVSRAGVGCARAGGTRRSIGVASRGVEVGAPGDAAVERVVGPWIPPHVSESSDPRGQPRTVSWSSMRRAWRALCAPRRAPAWRSAFVRRRARPSAREGRSSPRRPKRPRRAFRDCPRSEKPEADTFCTPEGCKKYLPRALGTTRGFRKYLGDVSGTLRGSEITSEMSLEPLGVPEVPTSGSRNPSGCSESTSLGLLAARDLLSVSLARFWSLRELHRRSASAS